MMLKILTEIKKINLIKDALRKDKEWLQPGWYFIRNRIAKRLECKISNSVPLFPRAASGQFRRYLKAIIFIPFSIIKIKHECNSFNTLVLFSIENRTGSYSKYFDFQNKLVTTNYNVYGLQPSYANEIIRKKHLLSELINVNEIRIISDGVTAEPLIEDGLLTNKGQNDLERIFRYYINEIGKKSKECSISFISKRKALLLLNSSLKLDWPDDIKEIFLLNQTQIVKYLCIFPLIPSHGDFLPRNIILSEEEPVAIDIEHVSLRPCYYDLLFYSLYRSEETDSVWNKVINGYFKKEIKEFLFHLNINDNLDFQVLFKTFLICLTIDFKTFSNKENDINVNLDELYKMFHNFSTLRKYGEVRI